jgi:hypothetical protein
MRLSTSLILILAIGLVGFSFVLAPAVTPGWAEVPDGRFIFNKRCATCHDAGALTERLAKMQNAERQTFLDRFLARHHARDRDERALIIDYLSKHRGS